MGGPGSGRKPGMKSKLELYKLSRKTPGEIKNNRAARRQAAYQIENHSSKSIKRQIKTLKKYAR